MTITFNYEEVLMITLALLSNILWIYLVEIAKKLLDIKYRP